MPSAGLRAATVPDPVAWAGKWGRSIPVRGIHSHALGATELRPLLRARTRRRTRMSNRRRPLTSTPPADLSSFDVAPFSQHTIRIYRTAALVWSPTHTHNTRDSHFSHVLCIYLYQDGRTSNRTAAGTDGGTDVVVANDGHHLEDVAGGSFYPWPA